MNDTFDANLENLKKLHKKFFNPTMKALTKKEALNLIKSAGINIPEKDMSFCFGMSKMSVLNELTQASNIAFLISM